MQFLKSLLRGFLSFVFKLSLVLLVIIGPLVMVFGTSGQLKDSLKTSKIYDNLVTNIVDNAAKDSSNQATDGQQDPSSGASAKEEESPFSQPAVQEAAKKAFTPAFVQSTGEQIIDGMYNWLQGKTSQPEITIDVSDVKQRFTEVVSEYAVNRAKALPACTASQARQLTSDKIDPLTISCLPAGFDVESLRTEVAKVLDKQETANGEQKENILQKQTITGNDFKFKDSPIVDFENTPEVPTAYQWLVRLPWILGGLAIVSGGLAVLLHDEKRRGIRSLATITLVIGVLTLLGIIVTSFIFGKLKEAGGPLSKIDANIQEPVIALVDSLSSAFNHNLLLFGIAYTLLGAGTLLALHFTKPNQPNEHEPVAHEPETTEVPANESSEKTDEQPTGTPAEKPNKPSNKLTQ